MTAIQLELWDTETDVMRREIAELRKTTANVRRGLFARHDELAKFCMKLQEQIDELKKQGFSKQPIEVLNFTLPMHSD